MPVLDVAIFIIVLCLPQCLFRRQHDINIFVSTPTQPPPHPNFRVDAACCSWLVIAVCTSITALGPLETFGPSVHIAFEEGPLGSSTFQGDLYNTYARVVWVFEGTGYVLDDAVVSFEAGGRFAECDCLSWFMQVFQGFCNLRDAVGVIA